MPALGPVLASQGIYNRRKRRPYAPLVVRWCLKNSDEAVKPSTEFKQIQALIEVLKGVTGACQGRRPDTLQAGSSGPL